MIKGYNFGTNESVTAAKLHALIESGTLSADDVATSHVQNSAITANKLASNSVTTAKIADGNVTGAKLDESARGNVHTYAAATGTDTYAATLSPAPTAYTTGQVARIKFTNANTGAATLNLNSLGAKSIKNNGAALSAGAIPAGAILELTYDGTNFEIGTLSAAAAASGETVVAKTGSYAITSGDDGKTFTNEGATALVPLTLPPAAANLRFKFVVQDVDGLKVTADTGDTIRFYDLVTISAGYIQSTTIGSVIELIAINSTEWIARYALGSWDIQTS